MPQSTKRKINQLFAQNVISPILRIYNKTFQGDIQVHGHCGYYSKVVVTSCSHKIKPLNLSIFNTCACWACQTNYGQNSIPRVK